MSPAAPAIRTLIGALAVVVASTVNAQVTRFPPPPTPWVQVEVVVFRHLDSTLVADEAWPAEPQLAYPDPLQILIAPGSPAHNAALAAREFDQSLAAEEGSASLATQVEEMPFLRLAGPETLLADRAARLAASHPYRLLGHLAWREPLPESARPVSVLVTAGNQVGTHYEVEGYLTLSRARYLHADITLWLNELDAGAADGLLLPEVPVPQEPPGGADNAPAPQNELAQAEPAEPALQVEPVRSTRTVVLHTARRLAPGEVHYLDHPLFGVLLMARSWDPSTHAPATEEQVEPQAPGAAAPVRAPQTPTPEGAEATPPPDGAQESPPPD